MSGHQLSTLDAQLASGDLLILVTGKLKVLNPISKESKPECDEDMTDLYDSRSTRMRT